MNFIPNFFVISDQPDWLVIVAARSGGDVDKASNRALDGVRMAVAQAHFVSIILSTAFEGLKDFFYMWKAWKVMMYR